MRLTDVNISIYRDFQVSLAHITGAEGQPLKAVNGRIGRYARRGDAWQTKAVQAHG